MKRFLKTLSEKQNRYAVQAAHIAVFILVIIFLFLLFKPGFLDTYKNHQFEGTGGYKEDSWVLKQGDTMLDPHLEVPAFSKLEKGKVYTMSTRLSYDGSVDDMPCGFYFVDHMYTRVLLDGQEIYSYMPDDVVKQNGGKSPGNVYVCFQLPHDCRGKELTIEVLPTISSSLDLQFPCPLFGNFSTVTVHTFWADLPRNSIMILAGFMGIAAILFATLALKGSTYREGLFIGIFAILFGLYSITESNFDFYMISNPYYTYLLDYTCFTLIPIFLIAFLRERLDPRQRKYALIMISIGVIMFAAEMILHFSGIMDMREFLPVLHVVYFADFVIMFFFILMMKKSKQKIRLILQMIPLLLGMLLDVLAYYQHWRLSTSDSNFTAVGVIIFLICEMYQAWKYSIDVYTESVRSCNYRQMAYVDALTGIGNRRAFDMEKDAIHSKKKFSTLMIASTDVNNLKLTNDTMGHAAGDFLIRNAAEVLTDLAEGYGAAYRVGGDEFIAFLYNVEQKEFDERLARMHAQIAEINSNSEAKLALAMGCVVVTGGEYLETALEEADRRMYENKALLKAGKAE